MEGTDQRAKDRETCKPFSHLTQTGQEWDMKAGGEGADEGGLGMRQANFLGEEFQNLYHLCPRLFMKSV